VQPFQRDIYEKVQLICMTFNQTFAIIATYFRGGMETMPQFQITKHVNYRTSNSKGSGKNPISGIFSFLSRKNAS